MKTSIIEIPEDYNTNLLPPEAANDVNDYPEASFKPSDDDNKDSQISIKPNIRLSPLNNDTTTITSTDIIFKPTETIRKWKNEKDTFSFIQCPIITTYYSGPIPYSQLTNPSTIENNPEYNLKFLLRGNKNNYLSNSFQLPPTLMLDTISNEELEDFIYSLNILYLDENYMEITNNNASNKTKAKCGIFCYGFAAFLMCLGIGACIYLLFDQEKNIAFWSCVLVPSLIILLMLYLMSSHIRDLMNADYILMEEMITYRIKCDEIIKAFVAVWNMKMFHKYNIDISLPISLDYVMFNMNKNQRILIKHHPLGAL